MKKLIIDKTKNTPQIIFNKEANNFEISGRSLPEEVTSFFSPVFDWLEEYIANPNDKTVFKLKLEYVNSSTRRVLQEILTVLERIKAQGKDIIIAWYYLEDDLEMKEVGIDYSEIIDVPFDFISYSG
jgi:hypothetical protein